MRSAARSQNNQQRRVLCREAVTREAISTRRTLSPATLLIRRFSGRADRVARSLLSLIFWSTEKKQNSSLPRLHARLPALHSDTSLGMSRSERSAPKKRRKSTANQLHSVGGHFATSRPDVSERAQSRACILRRADLNWR